MAYAGLGVPDEAAMATLEQVYSEELQLSRAFGFTLARRLIERHPRLPAADLIASTQEWVSRVLVRSLEAAVSRMADAPSALCFTGGCALNIVWDTALRDSRVVEQCWAPPFPNDSGSAIGAAAALLLASGRGARLSWDVYAGPPLAAGAPGAAWEARSCTPSALGELLALAANLSVLHGRAEIGPRALGHRSILGHPRTPATKDRLNEAKGRESYRPVAPICLEVPGAALLFPRTPDPYMLFTHEVRSDALDEIPPSCTWTGLLVFRRSQTCRIRLVQRSCAPSNA